ncbi:TPA: AraC family transcriptional regulator [Klebsiella variicola]|uniref:AraC family transcriptional regulator n=1 Tax=Klebsiella variicola TaxID=244366 RepID=UPI0031F31BFB|nr:AraC family transcriptional regulator [Klebsiella variicola]HBR0931940.1 AraC family transcriptional regulator [Klebsiella variicola]HBU5896987.1 AraC family transcriptional regulator [Klebsiella variicola]HBU5898818.1 AraC family transcriptional regulator [Klebsiella variicola]
MLNSEWLLDNLSIENSVFHVGKYCGSWKGGTSGSGKASYHLVMEGHCWLHCAQHSSALRLEKGDMVFILQDCPFVLSSHENAQSAYRAPVQEMQPLTYKDETSTALACGFITFKTTISQMLLSFLPQVIVFKAQDDRSGSIGKLVAVINREATQTALRSEKLIASLTELLFFMVIRHYLSSHTVKTPLDNIPLTTEFLNLMAEIVLFPARPWTVEAMARASGLSRSWFIQRFNQVSPLSPAEIVRHIRIALACQHIAGGVSLTQSAERVGYLSQAAFNRAFQRITGVTPGRYSQQCRDNTAAQQFHGRNYLQINEIV